MEATVRPDNPMSFEPEEGRGRPFTPNSDSAARQDTPEEQGENSAGKANTRRTGVGLKLQLTDTRPGTATSSEHDGNSTPRAFLDRRPGTTDSALASMPRFATTTMKFAATMRPMTATLGATAGGFYKTLQQATATLFRTGHDETAALQGTPDGPTRRLPVFYNLNPELINTGGIKNDAMPPKTWRLLRAFCLGHDITQADLERLYKRFSSSLESTARPEPQLTPLLEETRQQGLKRIASTYRRKRPGKKLYTISLHSLLADFKGSNIEHILAVCAYGINEVPTPQLPVVSADEKAAMEMGFADIIFKVWSYCLPSEHDFVVLLFKTLLDKLDSEAYRPLRSAPTDAITQADVLDTPVSHTDFLNVLSRLYPRPPAYFSILDDQVFPEGARSADIPLRTLVRCCYLYPVLAVPVLAARAALRRRIFGEAFWAKMDGVANRPADDSALLASAFNLPASPFSSSLIQLARRPAEAEAFTVRMLCRSVYFQGNEEAMFGSDKVDYKSLRLHLLTRYGYREPEALLYYCQSQHTGLQWDTHEGGGKKKVKNAPRTEAAAPVGGLRGGLRDEEVDYFTSSHGWIKMLDPKYHAHFFYNTYSGDSTWDPPRQSKYFRVHREENRNRVAQVSRRVKVARLMYYDDPILAERREAIRLGKLPKGKSSGLLVLPLGTMTAAASAWKTLMASLTAPLTAISRTGTLALTAMKKGQANPASIFVCGGTSVPGESDMTMEGETTQRRKTRRKGEGQKAAAA